MVKRRKKEEERKTRWMNLRGITCNFKQVQKKRNQIGHRKIRSGWNLEPSGTVLSTAPWTWMCVTNKNKTEKGSHSASRVVCEYQASISIGQAERNAIGLS